MKHKTMLKSAISHDLMGVGRTNLFCSGLKLRLGLVLLMGAGLLVACSGGGKQLNVPSPPTYTLDGLANCYMVAPGGTVTFPITRAITIGRLPASATAVVSTLWDDNNVIKTAKLLDSGNSHNITVKASSRQGNAVIALQDIAGTIYWSWHIWVVDYDPNTGRTWTNPYNPAYTFMDRNIGATEATYSCESFGLFYQWGRKDPFSCGMTETAGFILDDILNNITRDKNKKVWDTSDNTDGIAHGILESIRNPTTFFTDVNGFNWLPSDDNTLWNTYMGKKTVYDPCPIGWRVPTWRGLKEFPWRGLYEGWPIDLDRKRGLDWSNPPGSGNGIYKATGCIHDHNDRHDDFVLICAWSANGFGDYAWCLARNIFTENITTNCDYSDKSIGQPVRCVQE
jgi:hypothetical protein